MGKYKFSELYLLTNPSVPDNREPYSGRQVSRTLSKECLALSHGNGGADPHRHGAMNFSGALVKYHWMPKLSRRK